MWHHPIFTSAQSAGSSEDAQNNKGWQISRRSEWKQRLHSCTVGWTALDHSTSKKEEKSYGLLLTCMCSRAVDIEMFDDLTTDAFINALRSFIAIRGTICQIRCDNGTNIVGARREFVEALKEMDQEELKELGCEFIMNTPSSSYMGGIWERQIRTITSAS